MFISESSDSLLLIILVPEDSVLQSVMVDSPDEEGVACRRRLALGPPIIVSFFYVCFSL